MADDDKQLYSQVLSDTTNIKQNTEESLAGSPLKVPFLQISKLMGKNDTILGSKGARDSTGGKTDLLPLKTPAARKITEQFRKRRLFRHLW